MFFLDDLKKEVPMPLNEELQVKLKKRYQPSSMVDMKYKGNDMSFKTDEDGNAVVLFIGSRDEEGRIKGERYVRTLRKDENGTVVKDHWDRKGKVT